MDKTLFVFSTNRAMVEHFKKMASGVGVVLPDGMVLGEFFESIIAPKICVENEGADAKNATDSNGVMESKNAADFNNAESKNAADSNNAESKNPQDLTPSKIPAEVAKLLLLSTLKDFKNELYASHFARDLFEKSFGAFLETGDFAYKFFAELRAQKIALNTLKLSDFDAEFERHFALLGAVYERYLQNLKMRGFCEPRSDCLEYVFLESALEKYDQIEIFLDGVLNKNEREILEQVAQKKSVKIHFSADRFNINLLEKSLASLLKASLKINHSYTLENGKLTQESALSKPQKVEAYSFSNRIHQVAMVFEKINSWAEAGVALNSIVVVTPEKNFCKFLELYDTERVLNFAMGKDIKSGEFYGYLSDFFECVKEKNAPQDFNFLEFLDNLITGKKHNGESFKTPLDARIVENLSEFRFSLFKTGIKNFNAQELLHLLMARVEAISVDDVSGGVVRVIEPLESRGVGFERVIIVDFNQSCVPKISDADMFLNAKIRTRAGLPTIEEARNLQNHYFYSLISNAKEVVLGFVKSEEATPAALFGFLKDEFKLAVKHDAFALFNAKKLGDYAPDSVAAFELNGELSPSALSEILTCKRRYFLKYCVGLKGETNKSASQGVAAHALIESAFGAFEKGELVAPEKLRAALGEALDKSVESCAGAARLEAEILRLRLEKLANEPAHFHFATEWSFSGLEVAGFKFCGRIDRVEFDKENIYFVDYKNKNSSDLSIKNDEKRTDFAMAIYRMALDAHRADFAHFGLKPNAPILGSYFALKDSKKVDLDLETQTNLLMEKLSALSQEALESTPCEDEKHCLYCQFSTICGRD